jgi:transketolase
MAEKRATREAYGETLVELGRENPNIVVLDADLAKSTTTIKFKKVFPTRFFDCGVAEQNMMCIAAGLATTGKICFTGSFAIFATGRAFEQVRNTIGYGRLNVKICPSHAGITVGPDGSSHQTVEDIALMRVIPSMRVIVPADYYEAKAAIKFAASVEGPVYVRLGREKIHCVFDENYLFLPEHAIKLREGETATIFATGVMVKKSLEAAEVLAERGVEVEVINVHTIKPLDKKTILESVAKTRRVVTVEEHSVIGGLGSAIAEILSENLPTKMVRVGILDKYGCSGKADELLQYYGLTPAHIVRAVESLL